MTLLMNNVDDASDDYWPSFDQRFVSEAEGNIFNADAGGIQESYLRESR